MRKFLFLTTALAALAAAPAFAGENATPDSDVSMAGLSDIPNCPAAAYNKSHGPLMPIDVLFGTATCGVTSIVPDSKGTTDVKWAGNINDGWNECRKKGVGKLASIFCSIYSAF